MLVLGFPEEGEEEVPERGEEGDGWCWELLEREGPPVWVVEGEPEPALVVESC